MNSKTACMYVYDVDGEGECLCHFIECDGETVKVCLDESVKTKPFWEMQQAMHARMGHTLVMEETKDNRTAWSVRIGRGDFAMMLTYLSIAMETRERNMRRGGRDVQASLN